LTVTGTGRNLRTVEAQTQTLQEVAMRRLAVALSLILSLLLLSAPSPASAQEISAEVAGGGYSFMRDFITDENYPLGWFLSGGWPVADWFTAVGEISGMYKTYDFSLDSESFSTTTRQHSYLGGVRRSWQVGTMRPFGQFLAGVTRESGGVTIFRQSIATPETKLTLQPGGGVEVFLTDHLGVRLGADYRRIFADRENTEQEHDNQLRVAAGVVVGIRR
jgi:hypothetical protein